MLFILSTFGLVISTYLRRILIAILVCLELLLLSSVLSNVTNSLILDEGIGQIFICFIITLAGAETSCGLALIVSYYRSLGSVSLEPNN